LARVKVAARPIPVEVPVTKIQLAAFVDFMKGDLFGLLTTTTPA
jgi:hypothetical protein